MAENVNIVMLPVDSIEKLNVKRIREWHPELDEYQNLKRSIAHDGFDPARPLLVRPLRDPVTKQIIPNKWQIMDGHHRFMAATEVGLSQVPCVVRDMSDSEMQQKQYRMNEHVPTSLKEKAAYFKQYMQDHPLLTQAQIADEHSISQAELSRLLRFDKLTDEAKGLIDAGKITPTAALALVSIPTEFQNQFLEDAMVKPVGQFIDYLRAQKKAISEAQRTGKDLTKDEFPPVLLTKDEIIAKMNQAKTRLDELDPSAGEEYISTAARLRTLQEVLQVDPDTLAYKKAKKEQEKEKKELEKAQKKQAEAEKALEAVKARNTGQPVAVTAGID